MFFAITSLFIASSLSWGADLFHHELRQFPRRETCDLTAAELAKRFHEISGAEVYWAGTLKQDDSTCDIKISYIAPKEVELISTIDESGLGATRKGTKRSLRECETDLTREIALFKQSTGVDYWIAYCKQESSFLNDTPFIPVVQGIGKARLKFYSSDSVFGLPPNEGWPTLLASIEKAAAEQRLPLASITLRPYISAPRKEATFRYYADERLYLRADELAEHTATETCTIQVEEIRAALFKAKRPPLSVYCGKYADKQFRLGIVTLSPNIFGMADMKTIEDSKQFANLAACRADLPSTIDFYRSKLGKNILAGMCADSSRVFQITLIEERKTPAKPKMEASP